MKSFAVALRQTAYVVCVAGAMMWLGCAGVASAQAEYPDHPLRLVVPYPPGALTDILARVIGDRLATSRSPITRARMSVRAPGG